MEALEERLRKLTAAGIGDNRIKWAREWQERGKKVVGLSDSLVPEEVVYAAGMLPWRIQGTWETDVPLAAVYRIAQSNTFLTHVLQSLLSGQLAFLDGVICSNRDEEFVRFRDFCEWLGKFEFAYLLEVPAVDSDFTRLRFSRQLREFIRAIEEFGSVEIDDQSLRNAIATYNKGRELLRRAYELRKRESPALSGGEALGLALAATVMPRSQFNEELETLLPHLETREVESRCLGPRILLSSDLLDNPAFIDLIEDTGCLVAMDDMDTGSRYFWECVDDCGDDPVYSLASRYLKNNLPRMFDWRGQAAQIVRWTEEYRIDAVLELPDVFDYTRGFRRPFLERWLKEAGIPSMSFDRSYSLQSSGQLKTRVEAFLEMLGSQGIE